MILKIRNIPVSNHSQVETLSLLNNHLKYLQYRDKTEQESKAGRIFFNAHYERLNWQQVAKAIILHEPAGDFSYYRMVLVPTDNELITDWKIWTRALMSNLEKHLNKSLNWYAINHRNTDYPHMHIILQGIGTDHKTGYSVPVKLNSRDLKFIRDKGREYSEYENLQFIEKTLKELRQHDTIILE